MPTPKRLGNRVYLCPLIVTLKEDSDPSFPTMEVVADVIDNRLQITHISFTAGDREIQRSDLRAISIEEVREHIAADFGMVVDSTLGTATLTVQADDQGRIEGNRKNARTVDLAKVAEVYESAEKAPVRAVADAFGRSHRWASLRVAEAEKGGLLVRRPGSGRRG